VVRALTPRGQARAWGTPPAKDPSSPPLTAPSSPAPVPVRQAPILPGTGVPRRRDRDHDRGLGRRTGDGDRSPRLRERHAAHLLLRPSRAALIRLLHHGRRLRALVTVRCSASAGPGASETQSLRVPAAARRATAERLVQPELPRCRRSSPSRSFECIAPSSSRKGSTPAATISIARSTSTSPARRSSSARTSSATSGSSASR
jgi:hypothetical protein